MTKTFSKINKLINKSIHLDKLLLSGYSLLKIFLSLLSSLFSIFQSKDKNHPNTLGFQIKSKPFPHLLIQSPKIIPKIFWNENTQPAAHRLGNLFKRWLGNSLGCYDTRNLARNELKIIFKPLFDTSQKDLDSLINEWEEELKQLFKESNSKKLPVSIEAILSDLPLRFILRKVFGPTFIDHYKDKFDVLKRNAEFLMSDVYSNNYSKMWIYQFLPTKTNKILNDFRLGWEKLLDLAIVNDDVKREGMYISSLKTFKNSEKQLGHKIFSQTLLEMIFAKQAIVSPSVAWLLTHYSLCSKFTDSLAFIEESARLSPIFPILIPHITIADIVLEGINIPKDTIVLIDFISLGKSSEGEINDLDTFNPERYINDCKSTLVSQFGYGWHQYPEIKLANDLSKAILDHISKNWIFLPTQPTTLTQIKANLKYRFMMPSLDVWLLNKRNSIYFNCTPTPKNTTGAFVAISIHEKSPFLQDPKNAEMVVKILAGRHEDSVILLADEIAKYNFEAFNHKTPLTAVKKAEKFGEIFADIFNPAFQNFSNGKVRLCKWADINLPSNLDLLFDKYPELKSRVEAISKKYLETRGRGKDEKSYQKKLNLSMKYIISEVPLFLNGIWLHDKWYNLFYYCESFENLTKFGNEKDTIHRLAIDLYLNSELFVIKEEISSLIGRPNHYKIPGFIGIDTDNKMAS